MSHDASVMAPTPATSRFATVLRSDDGHGACTESDMLDAQRCLVIVGTLLLELIAGCSSPKEPGTDGCSFTGLATDAVVSYSAGGGIAGASSSFVAFADGRVEVQTNRDRSRTANVGTDRIARLTSELEATGAHDEDPGCYEPDEPTPDGIDASIVVRRGSAVLQYSHATDGDAPSAVTRALDVARRFFTEVDSLAR